MKILCCHFCKVWHDEAWGTVCGPWTDKEAVVACRMMGYSGGSVDRRPDPTLQVKVTAMAENVKTYTACWFFCRRNTWVRYGQAPNCLKPLAWFTNHAVGIPRVIFEKQKRVNKSHTPSFCKCSDTTSAEVRHQITTCLAFSYSGHFSWLRQGRRALLTVIPMQPFVVCAVATLHVWCTDLQCFSKLSNTKTPLKNSRLPWKMLVNVSYFCFKLFVFSHSVLTSACGARDAHPSSSNISSQVTPNITFCREQAKSGCTVWTAADLSPALVTVSLSGMVIRCVTTPGMYSWSAMVGRLLLWALPKKSAPSQSSGKLWLCTGWSSERNTMQGSSWLDNFHKT